MKDDESNEEIDPYLWEGTGTPDTDVARLEKALGVLRHKNGPPALPPRVAARPRIVAVSLRWVAVAAGVVLAVMGGWFVWSLSNSTWSVRAIAGVPDVAGRSVVEQGRLAPGEWLVTDGLARAQVAVGSIGSVDVDPNTRVQLVKTGTREHRMALERGTIHARIWAPPKFFYVDTEAAVAVDLGCAYTLQIDNSGTGLLRVTHGWVGFEREGRDTYVPEGAVCMTRSDKGPGTPRYEDAPSGYSEALMLLDFGSPDDPGRAQALDLVLSTTRKRDGLSLWHLLTRGTPAERARVYDRLAQLVPPPNGVTKEKVLNGDRITLNQWWDALGVDVSTWWRLLKKKW